MRGLFIHPCNEHLCKHARRSFWPCCSGSGQRAQPCINDDQVIISITLFVLNGTVHSTPDAHVSCSNLTSAAVHGLGVTFRGVNTMKKATCSRRPAISLSNIVGQHNTTACTRVCVCACCSVGAESRGETVLVAVNQ